MDTKTLTDKQLYNLDMDEKQPGEIRKALHEDFRNRNFSQKQFDQMSIKHDVLDGSGQANSLKPRIRFKNPKDLIVLKVVKERGSPMLAESRLLCI